MCSSDLSGDSISAFSREQIARAMETKASDPDSVHLVGCHRAVGQNLKLVASSLSGYVNYMSKSIVYLEAQGEIVPRQLF